MIGLSERDGDKEIAKVINEEPYRHRIFLHKQDIITESRVESGAILTIEQMEDRTIKNEDLKKRRLFKNNVGTRVQ